MPSFNTEGKSKEDLALVAQLAGLLTLDQTSTMSRTQIARVIERENRKQEAAAQAALQPKSVAARTTRGRKPKASITPVESAPAKKPGGRPRRKSAAEPVESIKVIETEPEASSSPAESTVAAKARRGKQPAVAAKKPGKKIKVTAVEPSQVTLPDLPVDINVTDNVQADVAAAPLEITPAAPLEITPAAAEMPEVPIPAADAEPVIKIRKKPGRKPANPSLTIADSGDVPAERSPEASEAAADKQDAPSSGHHVPPHHTLTARQPGQRRIRIIGSPESQSSAEPVQSASSGPVQRVKPGRPVKTVRTVTPMPDPDFQVEQPDQAEAAENSPIAESSATIVQLPVAHEQGHATAHRPAVEAGDIQAGVLEIMPDGYGFLRKENYLQGTKDIYVPPQYIRRFGLRMGDHVSGPVKLQRENDRYQALLYIKEVNGMSPEKMIRRPHFDRLTPIYPNERFILETVRNELSTRIIDLVAPIGKGQRGMIVSPPKAGKTILLQKIANAISVNNPDVKLIVLLIDERPEEVTDMQRSINGEVVYSTFDKTPENHTKVTELVLERAMRLVELKQDVVILLDSMTRLARAYNLSINPTGRTLSGGLDPGALYGPKRFFGAARNIENGGSLTIIATSLIETGSRMDEVIFEEFKGTGNMEVYLDRKMSEKRIFPAIDINKSGTRREELLMSNKELDAVWTIRKAFSQLDTTSVTEAIINLLLKTNNNQHFIASVNVSFNDKNVFEAMRGVKPSEAVQSSQSSQSGPSGRSVYGGYNSSGQTSNYRRMNTNDDD